MPDWPRKLALARTAGVHESWQRCLGRAESDDQRRGEARLRVLDSRGRVTENSTFETFDRMSQKIDQLEAEAEAGAELGQRVA